MALGWIWWRVWLFGAVVAAAVCLAGVALGGIVAHTQTSTQTSFTHNLEHTSFYTILSYTTLNTHTHIALSRKLQHTALSHATLSHTHKSFTSLNTQTSTRTHTHTAFTHTHTPFTRKWSHTTLSHTAFHTKLFYTQLFHTRLFHIQHCHCHAHNLSLSHTQSFAHSSIMHTVLSHNLSSTISYFFPHAIVTPVLSLLEEVDMWGYPVL